MRRILFWLLVFIGVTMVFRGCNDGGELLLYRGDSYADRIEDIKKEFRFLFRIKNGDDIYNGFTHRDTNHLLIFKDGILECIGKWGWGDGHVECSKFVDRKTGKESSMCHWQYLNPLIHTRSLVDRLGESKEYIYIPSMVEAGVSGSIDWGLTAAFIILQTFGGLVVHLMGIETSHPNPDSLINKLGFDYGRISIGLTKEDVLSLFGPPVYIDAESGVEYYGRFVSMGFPQILGIAYSNEVVVAVFSDMILDYRIIGQCYGGDYVGKIR